jgi:iron complex outermembrane recepter protein
MYQKAFIVTLLAVAVNQQLHAETAKAQISANDDIPTTTLDELTLYAGIKSGTVLWC